MVSIVVAIFAGVSSSVPVLSLTVSAFEFAKHLSSNDTAPAINDEAKGKNFAQMMCADFERPRTIAVCLHGSARAFPHRLVHQSMKENLFGDSFGADMTPFLHVMRTDARGDTAGDGDVFPNWSESQIKAAAQVLNIADEDIKIFNGPDMPLPTCSEFKDNFEEREKYEANGAKNHAKYLTYAKSLAGQLSHRKGCMDLIDAKETKTGSRFDVVILSRADLTYYLPLRPYCFYDLKAGRRFRDWFFMVSRDKATKLFVDPYNDFYGCKKPFKIGELVEGYDNYFILHPKEDVSLPVLVTRKPGAHHSLCGISFSLESSYFSAEELADLCRNKLIDGNPFNSYR